MICSEKFILKLALRLLRRQIIWFDGHYMAQRYGIMTKESYIHDNITPFPVLQTLPGK